MNLPNRLFFTGVPGSRWSSIAQLIETIPIWNTSDRTFEREYAHHGFTGHKGVYYGRGMEYEAHVDPDYLDKAWPDTSGPRIIKSHDWATCLDLIKERFPDDWIMLVYRPDLASYAWWFEVGGFQIKYPNYDVYKNPTTMLAEITEQNRCILDFGYRHGAQWTNFSEQWLADNFGYYITVPRNYNDILVTIIK